VIVWKTSTLIRFGRITLTTHDFHLLCFLFSAVEVFCCVFMFAARIGVVVVEEIRFACHMVVCYSPYLNVQNVSNGVLLTAAPSLLPAKDCRDFFGYGFFFPCMICSFTWLVLRLCPKVFCVYARCWVRILLRIFNLVHVVHSSPLRIETSTAN
jgi:hypothetical protein